MLRLVYFGLAFGALLALAMTWSYQILYTTPDNNNHKKHMSDNSTKYGYFLHITDFHLDKNYVPGTTIASACHRLPSNLEQDKPPFTGQFGTNGCDTPTILAQKTVDWISKEWKDKLDFVIWTGDNARHDWDSQMRRNRSDVYESNRIVANMLHESFGSIPLIPALGNNDVIKHNQITKGGTMDKDTNRLLAFYQQEWRRWIPEDQREDFATFGAFVVDVNPRLRALSLNTMYFIKKNKKVRGCGKSGPSQQHMHWFKQQLAKAKQDEFKVIVLGHVPPTEDSYRSSCLNAYTQISSAYSDVIIGHLYGHLNKDHFLLYDTSRPILPTDDTHRQSKMVSERGTLQHPIMKAATAMTTRSKPKVPKFARQLHDMYASLNPRSSGEFKGSPIVAIQITPSVLPRYYPTVRVYRYTKNPEEIALVGYDQYFANITEWEQPESQHDFQLLYSTEDNYGMTDLSETSFYNLAKQMVNPYDRTGRYLWQEYVNNIFVHTRRIF